VPPIVHFKDLGRIDYKSAWDTQTELHQDMVKRKLANRKVENESIVPPENNLLFCEHNPVFTLGKSGDMKNLLISPEQLQTRGVDFYPINRGGDITYHGPGQLTAYPIFDLEQFITDVGLFLRKLEEAIIQVLAIYNLKGERLDGATGVWLDPHKQGDARKICAMGVHISRWVTMHGFAFNISTDLRPFSWIIPCGISDKRVTSLHLEAENVHYPKVKAEVLDSLRNEFHF
jgi:lipoyl(octanoyl) transferase